MSLTKKFNPANQTHVLWLKKLSSVLETTKITDPRIQERELKKVNLQGLMEENPMKVSVTTNDLMDFPAIHFGLAMIYSNAVLNGEAWVPPQKC